MTDQRGSVPRFAVLWHYLADNTWTCVALTDDKGHAAQEQATWRPAMEPGEAVVVTLVASDEERR